MGIVKEGDSTVIRWPLRRKTLADFYQLHDDSLREILRGIGIKHNRTLSPNECARFFAYYGLPNDKCDVRIPGVTVKLLQYGIDFEGQ